MRWILSFIISLNLFANYAEEIKTDLEDQLKNEFIWEVDSMIGRCSENPLDCLKISEEGSIYSAEENRICFPYTNCGYYKCMEKKFRCSEVGVDYFTKLAYPTCNQYVENIKKGWFTKKGVEWIYSVMVCLQKGLSRECDLNGNCPVKQGDRELRKKTCDHITNFTLEYHPGCYINSGVGVCHLPIKDKINIWRTVGKYLTPREREEAYKVVFHCISPS